MSARLDNPPDPPAESLPRKRKLAAILHADVAGFSRLMGADEAGTHRALGELRAAVDPLIAAHGGRIVGTAGDSLLADFLSVVDALSCAVEAQHVARIINDPIPPERRLELRIGVNLGDVIVDGADIFGDGVNIAARLEALAEPGTVCISQTVYDQVRNKLDLAIDRSAAIVSRISPSRFALTLSVHRPRDHGPGKGGEFFSLLRLPRLQRPALLHGRFTPVRAASCSGSALRRSRSRSQASPRRRISPAAHRWRYCRLRTCRATPVRISSATASPRTSSPHSAASRTCSSLPNRRAFSSKAGA